MPPRARKSTIRMCPMRRPSRSCSPMGLELEPHELAVDLSSHQQRPSLLEQFRCRDSLTPRRQWRGPSTPYGAPLALDRPSIRGAIGTMHRVAVWVQRVGAVALAFALAAPVSTFAEGRPYDETAATTMTALPAAAQPASPASGELSDEAILDAMNAYREKYHR